MLAFCQWLQATDFFTALRGSGIVYPTILSLHMVAIAFFGCMILLTDLRLMGAGWKNYPVADMIKKLRPLKHAGLTLIVLCGLLLFGAKAEEYYYNIFFRTKMIVLALIIVHAIVFRAGVYKNGEALDKGGLTGQARAAGALSLVLWTGMAICGRGIGYIEPDLFKLHAQTGSGDAPGTILIVNPPALRGMIR